MPLSRETGGTMRPDDACSKVAKPTSGGRLDRAQPGRAARASHASSYSRWVCHVQYTVRPKVLPETVQSPDCLSQRSRPGRAVLAVPMPKSTSVSGGASMIPVNS